MNMNSVVEPCEFRLHVLLKNAVVDSVEAADKVNGEADTEEIAVVVVIVTTGMIEAITKITFLHTKNKPRSLKSGVCYF
jgi:hypothetical protein